MKTNKKKKKKTEKGGYSDISFRLHLSHIKNHTDTRSLQWQGMFRNMFWGKMIFNCEFYTPQTLEDLSSKKKDNIRSRDSDSNLYEV